MCGLEGKTAIVTGATSGIGECAARELCALGATVFLAVRNKSKAEKTVRMIREVGVPKPKQSLPLQPGGNTFRRA